MLSAAILAGGQATRFGGRDKGSLIVDGRTIFERQIAELSRVAGEILLVGRTPDHAGIKSVADVMVNSGPLGGLHAALSEARGDTTVVVACDMPYITAPLMAYLAALTRDADAVVPRTERGYHPLCAAYTRAAIEPIARSVAAGRLRMTDFIADVRLRIVTAEEIGMFGDRNRLLANVNTPAEYDNLAALHAHEVSS